MRSQCKIKALIHVLAMIPAAAWGQTVTETILRESPKLSMSLGVSYDSNLQDPSTYSHRDGVLTRLIPRYKVSEDYTLIGSLGLSQRFTQENRTDFTNMGIALSRSLIPLGSLADLRPTLSVILPTNENQREIDTYIGSARATMSLFARTNTAFILESGTMLQLNSHQYSISRENGANIQSRVTPYLTVGWTLANRWQIIAYQDYDSAWTYRGTHRGSFSLDQSITYLAGRRWSMTVGHNNSGGLLTADGRHSNVKLFDRRSSTVYLSAVINY